uniref:Uncharacterized protein n=1 Tax=Trieres chinensis TaxID=1514140 RepID=A0A7S2A959_TRICV
MNGLCVTAAPGPTLVRQTSLNFRWVRAYNIFAGSGLGRSWSGQTPNLVRHRFSQRASERQRDWNSRQQSEARHRDGASQKDRTMGNTSGGSWGVRMEITGAGVGDTNNRFLPSFDPLRCLHDSLRGRVIGRGGTYTTRAFEFEAPWEHIVVLLESVNMSFFPWISPRGYLDKLLRYK